MWCYLNCERSREMKGGRVRKCVLSLPPKVVDRLKAVAKKMSLREMKRFSLSGVVLAAVQKVYFRPKRKKRRTQGAK